MGALAGAAARLRAGTRLFHFPSFGQRSLVHRLQTETFPLTFIKRIKGGFDTGVDRGSGGAQDVWGHEWVGGKLAVVLEPGVVTKATHLNPLVWIHCQQLLYKVLGLLGYVPPGLSFEREIPVFDFFHDFLCSGVGQVLFLTLKRHLAGQHGVQNDPQTPQVTGLIVAIIFEDLRRCVLQGEAGSLQELIVWWFEASEAKVYDFYLRVLTLICEEQVLRFKVSVHHPNVVHVTDGRHQLAHDAAGFCLAEMLLSADPLQQFPSTEQLQDQVRVELVMVDFM